MKSFAIYRIITKELLESYGVEGLINLFKLVHTFEPCEDIYKAWVFHDVRCLEFEALILESGYDSICLKSNSGFDTIGSVMNKCIQLGLKTNDYVTAVPASCLFRDDGINLLRATFDARTEAYYGIGVWKGSNLEEYIGKTTPMLHSDYKVGDASVLGITRPWVVFTLFSDVKFNENLSNEWLIRRELLWRIGYPGLWDREDPDACEAALKKKSKYFSTVGTASWVWQPSSEIIKSLTSNIADLLDNI